jgi:hypothetical protein
MIAQFYTADLSFRQWQGSHHSPDHARRKSPYWKGRSGPIFFPEILEMVESMSPMYWLLPDSPKNQE